MNEHDKKNLDFLMKSEQEDFDKWMDEASHDDIEYALEIIRQSKLELMIEQIELQEASVMYEDDVGGAKEILNKLRRK